MPQALDGVDLGEEAVATDVEPPAVALGGPADAADDVVGLEHRAGMAGLAQLVGGGQAGRPGADCDDVGAAVVAADGLTGSSVGHLV